MIKESEYLQKARQVVGQSLKSINGELFRRFRNYARIVLSITLGLLLLLVIFTKNRDSLLEELFAVLLGCLSMGLMIGVYYLIIDNRYFYVQRIRLLRYKKDYYSLKTILGSKQKFALYLRDFGAGRKSITYSIGENSNDNKGIGTINGSMKMNKITSFFRKQIPVVFLNNAGEITDNYRGLTVYATNEVWFNYFQQLADAASIILLDLHKDAKISEHIDAEIRYIISMSKAILLFCHLDVYNNLKIVYPAIEKLVVLHESSDFIEIEFKTYPVEDIFFSKKVQDFRDKFK